MSDIEASPASRNAPKWVKWLVAAHVIAITSWSLPDPQTVVRATSPPGGTNNILYFNDRYVRYSPVRQYIQSLGFWQSWDMFSPNPLNTDYYGDAIVTFKDGSSKIFIYPRIKDLPFAVKYVKERYRKFYERINGEGSAYTWPVISQRIALESDSNPKNPPVMVQLRHHYKTTQKPINFTLYSRKLLNAMTGKGPLELMTPAPEPLPEYSSYIFYTYFVDQAALPGGSH